MRRIRCTPGFVALLCGAAYFGSFRLLVVFLLAAALHEWGHLLCAGVLKLPISHLTLSALGAELFLNACTVTSFRQDLLLALSGPAANLAAVCVCAWLHCFPLFLGANFLLGCFNLLPIRPLDGGNGVYALLACLLREDAAQHWSLRLSRGAAVVVLLTGVWIVLLDPSKPWLLLVGVWLCGGAFCPGKN